MKQKKDTLGMPDSLLSRQLLHGSNRMRAGGTGFLGAYIWVVILILLLVALLIGLYVYRVRFMDSVPVNSYQKQSISTDRLPDRVPVNLPYLAEGVVVHNFETPNPNGVIEGIRKWRVVTPLSEAAAGYEAYFKRFGWEFVTRLNTPGLQVFGVRKENIQLSVSIQPDTVDRTMTTIELTVKEQIHE